MRILLIGLLAVVAACGEGRAIFNVDVHSFLEGSGNDTVPYAVPPATSLTASTYQQISLPPGLGNSVVDSVRITTGSADLITASGAGTIGIELYVAADSAGTELPGALALSVPPTTVAGPGTQSVTITGDLSASIHDLFTQETLWIRIAATGNNSGVTLFQGDMALTALVLRVVMQEQIL